MLVFRMLYDASILGGLAALVFAGKAWRRKDKWARRTALILTIGFAFSAASYFFRLVDYLPPNSIPSKAGHVSHRDFGLCVLGTVFLASGGARLLRRPKPQD